MKTGRPNFSAILIARRALRYPSGSGEPNLRATRSFSVRPLRLPITITGRPWKNAMPHVIAASSPKRRSPWISLKSVKSASMKSIG